MFAAWNAANSPKRPSSSYAINTKDFPGIRRFFSKEAGFVFSKEQVERHARQLMRNNPTYYAAHPRFQADPPPTEAAF
jgi:hypothetical protein